MRNTQYVIETMEKYRTALILGYGRSGRAAERLLHAEGTETVVLTSETSADPEVAQALNDYAFDVCVVSPGFSIAHSWVCAVRDAGIPLLSELELGWSRHQGRTVAVTGSNGKSTAVKWIYEALLLDRRKAAIGGNYGIPACEAVFNCSDLEWLVLEVSSFQLETARDFRADVAVVLNVLPNHLDRHENLEIYRKTKARIFGPVSSPSRACLAPVGLLEVLRDDAGGAERSWGSFGGTPDADYFYENGRVFHGSDAVLDLRSTLFESPIIGSCTGSAVAAVCASMGIPFAVAQRVARHFEPLPHRLQRAGELGGVEYINDSKATNLAAVSAAVQACGKNIHLIAGGLPKESDYTFVKEVLAERVMSIYLIGQASRAMYQAWNGACPCVECGSLEEAFSAARNAAKPGDMVLLSPGCASFDQFRSFEERGERFMALFQDAVQAGSDAL
ncbi:UDP-N-acetylmuramoyl-L-alanine--D-glutamate ligase [Pontiella sulfatireligans]|uniref:UDP-N-acetylmuramoylalanine--D-glutamate ligase n=1 Tax=Pontiella sulfatireligans TaxID=2750658 RepID=A0A6C2UP08_9BACT|nr:UDP-N-acetylmuramoyl-L-alanine--D-glutamate ligase [Pontiella sulfatireligans]VGO21054.1 UDP-N-acetylmuramoylalanine--D-glutamate ligase [Pontiella sulfatireligans]